MEQKSVQPTATRASRTRTVKNKPPKTPAHKSGLPVKDEPSVTVATPPPEHRLPAFPASKARERGNKVGGWDSLSLDMQEKVIHELIREIKTACDKKEAKVDTLFFLLANSAKLGRALPEEVPTFPRFLAEWAQKNGYRCGYSNTFSYHQGFVISWQ